MTDLRNLVTYGYNTTDIVERMLVEEFRKEILTLEEENRELQASAVGNLLVEKELEIFKRQLAKKEKKTWMTSFRDYLKRYR